MRAREMTVRSDALSHSGTFRFQGDRLAYEIHGDGDRVIVLMHGLLLDANINRMLAQSLAAHGNRVVLFDLLGHGRSDRPRHASAHRMDRYARSAVALLDHLEVEQAVVGGVSLGANVALFMAHDHPQRVKAMFLEMPVLEWAAPPAAMVFVPLLLWVHYGRPLVALTSRALRRAPRTGIGPIDSFINAAAMHPDEIAAVLHGMLVGPMAPELDERRAIAVPTLIIGHQRDLVHPFSDAENLAGQLRDARLVQARSMFELRMTPTRLVREIAAFLDEVWQAPATVTRLRADG